MAIGLYSDNQTLQDTMSEKVRLYIKAYSRTLDGEHHPVYIPTIPCSEVYATQIAQEEADNDDNGFFTL